MMKDNQKDVSKKQIAIIGMGCRFPGESNTPEQFWQNILNGVDGIVDVPKGRWDIRKFYDEETQRPGKMHTKQAGFISQDLKSFDPLFFGISPREAEILDPMQRLLLEVSWEAFENAGLNKARINQHKTGVFVGGFAIDNKTIQLDTLNEKFINSHTPVGITLAMLSNRLSHAYNLKGPSLSIDTACSSSVISLHYAMQSLRNGDCELALVGGANTMLSPTYPIAMSKGQFLSKHSRCKAFDADAGGYVRAEGAGILILKPLEQAVEDGDEIQAVIVETGANQDGQTPGITLPNPDSQKDLVKQVYARAGVSADDISYVEAHGTGTKAGDPLELQALADVFEGRKDKCLVGSVKSNIGHLEAASGVAGVIKAAMTVRDKVVAPNLHFNNPNPDIPFDKIPLEVANKITQLDEQACHYASINSFGYGGANGHVLLRSPSEKERKIYQKRAADKPFYLVTLSAKSTQALNQLAIEYAEFIANDMEQGDKYDLDDIVYTLNQRRTHHSQRALFFITSKTHFVEQLCAFAEGSLEGITTGQFSGEQPENLCFVYSGMGPQWWKMGQALYQQSEVYKQSIDQIDQVFTEIAGWSVKQEMLKPEDESLMHQTNIAQPANFALQASLTKMLEAHGLVPDAVIGHSVGEVSAAYISGALSLEDACKVSYHRSRLQNTCNDNSGGMLAVGLSAENVKVYLHKYSEIDIAAINSPSAITLAGTIHELEALAAELQEQQIFNRFLKVEIAYHSQHMDKIEADIKQALADIKPQPTHLPLYSTVTAELIQGESLNAEYWWKNVRQSVLFADGIKAIYRKYPGALLEVGPHPVLSGSVQEILQAENVQPTMACTLNRKQPELAHFYLNIGKLVCGGTEPDWQTISNPNGQFVRLPNYPWQRDIYWHESQASVEHRLGRGGYIYLNESVDAPLDTWQVEINRYLLPYLNDHQVNDKVVFPGAGYVDAALCLHAHIYGTKQASLSNVEIKSMLMVADDQVPVMRIQYDFATRQALICNRDVANENAPWRTNAFINIDSKVRLTEPAVVDIEKLKKYCSEEVDSTGFYEKLASVGLQYGDYFRPIKALYKGDGAVLAKLSPAAEISAEIGEYRLHPTLLDAAFQSLVLLAKGETAYVPVSIETFDFLDAPKGDCWVSAKLRGMNSRSVFCDIQILDTDGHVLCNANNVTCTALESEESFETQATNKLYYPEWKALDALNTNLSEIGKRQVLLLANDSVLCKQIEAIFVKNSVNFVRLSTDKLGNAETSLLDTVVDSQSQESIQQALENVPYFFPDLVVDLWHLDNLGIEHISAKSVADKCFALRNVVVAVNRFIDAQPIDYLLITQGAQPLHLDTHELNVSGASAVSQMPLVMNEYANFNTISVDIDFEYDDDCASGILLEAIAADPANEVAFREHKRFGKFLAEQDANSLDYNEVTMSSDSPLSAVAVGRGFYYRSLAERPLTQGQVRIKVSQTLLDESDAFADQQGVDHIKRGKSVKNLGTEVHGHIVEVGGNSRWQIGDPVIALCEDGGLATQVSCRDDLVAAYPEHYADGHCPSYSAFMLAYYGLVELATIQAQDKVLILNADSATGAAAVSVALAKGAAVYAAVEDCEKNSEALTQLGVTQVLSLSTHEFVGQLQKAIDGSGIDLIYGYAENETKQLSMNLLSFNGHYIDIMQPQQTAVSLPAGMMWRNASYQMVNLHTLITSSPELASQLLAKTAAFIAEHLPKMIESQRFDANELEQAVTDLKSGKISAGSRIDFAATDIVCRIEKHCNWLTPHSTYLVTGGTSGFGLNVALQLAKWGCHKLVLASRSGAKGKELEAAMPEFAQYNCEIDVRALDVSNQQQVTALISELDNSALPLKGIIHSAGVLSDAPLAKMTYQDYERVLAPKVDGALNLHFAVSQLKNIRLDCFVLFSSVSALVGNPGQANYVAANAFLDAFAFYRRSKDLMATSVNWGALSDAGMVARDAKVSEILKQQGINPIASDYALQQLQEALRENDVQVGILDVDWRRWFNNNPAAVKSSRYTGLTHYLTTDLKDSPFYELYQELNELDQEQRQRRFEVAIAEQISKLLRLSVDQVDVSLSLTNLGIDSLTTNLLSVKLKEELDMKVTSMELLSGPTVSQLAKQHIEAYYAEEVVPA